MRIRLIKKGKAPSYYYVQYRRLFGWKTIDLFIDLDKATAMYNDLKKGAITPKGVIMEDYIFGLTEQRNLPHRKK